MEIRAKKDSLSSYCMDHLLQNYFGDHPYASAYSDLESIADKGKDVEELYAILYTPGNIVLSLSGSNPIDDVTPIIPPSFRIYDW